MIFADNFFSKKAYENSEKINYGTDNNKVDGGHLISCFLCSSSSSNNKINSNKILSKIYMAAIIKSANIRPKINITVKFLY